MLKKDCTFLKKQLKKEDCCLTKVIGCYVNAAKEIDTIYEESIPRLDLADVTRYTDIYKKFIGGGPGKKLAIKPLTSSGTNTGKEYLRELVRKHPDDYTDFFQRIINGYTAEGPYVILLGYGGVDLPYVGSDGIVTDEFSDCVYDFMATVICPVKMSKSELCYNEDKKKFNSMLGRWAVKAPAAGFLYPSLDEIAMEPDEIAVYDAKSEKKLANYINDLFGVELPDTGNVQVQQFLSMVQGAYDKESSFEEIKMLFTKIGEYRNCQNDDSETILKPQDMKRFVLESGASNEVAERMEQICKKNKEPIQAINTSSKKINITNGNVSITADIYCSNLIREQIVDGKKYIMIPVIADTFELNGVVINA